MNSVDFLAKLVKYFNIDGSEDDIKERIKTFSQTLNEMEKKGGRKYDYEATFKELLVHYKFQSFPLLADIYKYITYLPKPDKSENIEKEPKRRKLIVERFGYTYEFYEVDSSWDDVHTVAELNAVELQD